MKKIYDRSVSEVLENGKTVSLVSLTFPLLLENVFLLLYGTVNVSQAVAAILTGATIPSGRLTETYAKNIKDIPAENTQRDEAYIFYEERLSVGYRYFAGAQVPVLYPFGYGLSYTSFAYYDLKCTAVDNGFEITVGIKNTGCYAGKEVAEERTRSYSPPNPTPF